MNKRGNHESRHLQGIAPNFNGIGDVLKSAREKAGLTQLELSGMVGVSRAYYADVERGRYTPSLKVLSRLADILGIDLNFLKQNDVNARF